MREIINGCSLTLGTCYYPEHWKRELWKDDLRRMKQAGIEVIRIAEFAWSKIEPRENEFDYSFFDSFLDLAEKEEIKVIFCTPTATPPAWLTHKYPEVLNADMQGHLYSHGARRHYNYNSAVYREKSAIITEKAAAHYGKRSCIIGWQLDNEFNCECPVFYSESDSRAFRVFLQQRYGSLDALNDAWGTVFWNQTYTDWEEVDVPRMTYSDSTNPHRVLDYKRFISDSVCSFARLQSSILRRYIKPDDFITTNGIFGNLDYQRLNSESLDFITYDSYPNFAYCLADYKETDELKDRKWSRNLMEVRAISDNFGIMEQQSGANGWNTRMEAPNPRPGQLTLWTMQSVAHGADFISYFRWRTATMGTEIYWHGILDYSGRENRRLREVREVYDLLQKLERLAGAKYRAEVAVLKDYDNVWDAEIDVWHGRVEKQSQRALFAAAQATHTPLDYVYIDDKTPTEKLQKYKVIFYPHAVIVDDARAALLEAYVRNGGILIIGCRSGYKDRNGKCVMEYLPGKLARLTGADIPEYSFIAPDAGRVMIDWNGRQLTAAVFTDLLEAVGEAVVEARYTSDYFAGAGALVSNLYGKGRAYYYGTAFSEDAVTAFLENLGVAAPYADRIEAPETCELAVRERDGREYVFVLNYDKKPARVILHQKLEELLTGEALEGEIMLPGYGAAVFLVRSAAHVTNG